MQVDAVIARLNDRASGLRTVEGVAELAALMGANALAQQGGVAAYVIPTGLRGGQVTSASEIFVQSVSESVSVLLSMRNAGRTGDKALLEVGPHIDAVLAALCGWGPEDTPGVFQLVRAGGVSLDKGTFTYLIEFSIADQLRITP
ncbi:hypothetical protein EGN72_02460 [Pseudorhodobacter sp. E13]|uniref:phage tail terminator protein n=1 Tax=Pseudorhodobacter sp. E13 TaxID=2487931 RepID=UPI000F8E002D|nr:hypothetical protein [Pseudorhodobacter sp. E13]RUS64873.1 hypothetical protein EGN72_02460 [Pseudorhodobacter sp. E13]